MKTDEIKGKYEVDSPETKDQAEALLKDYYKREKAIENEQTKNKLPKRPILQSWRLRTDGVMIVVDGASGRKLEFFNTREVSEPFAYIETAADAETAALDAEAEAEEARGQLARAEAKAKAARAEAKKAADEAKTQERAEAKAKALEAKGASHSAGGTAQVKS